MDGAARDSLVMRLLLAMEQGGAASAPAGAETLEKEVDALVAAVSPDLDVFFAAGDAGKINTPHACELEPDRPCTGSKRCLRRGF